MRWTRPGVLATAAAVGAYIWVLAGTSPFTWPVQFLVPLAGGLAVALTWVRSHPRPQLRRDFGQSASALRSAWDSPLRLGLILWGAWLFVAVSWELSALFQHPRAIHPTTSSIFNAAFHTRAVKALVAVLWLALGREVVRR